MRVPIPHSLGKDEARRRLKARSGDLAGMMPGGMADVQVSWPNEDRMDLDVSAMGSRVNAGVELGESSVIVIVDLPGALKFFEPLIRGAIEQKGQKLLK
jgi:hypothetical protein